MVVFQEEDAGGHSFTVRPNCAIDWRWTKRLIIFFACCFAVVGWYFTSIGAWLVLPFAGLEFVVLAAGFYLAARTGHAREIIEIRGDELRILRGGRKLEEVARLSRHWTWVALVRDPSGWYPSRLLLRCHGQTVEIRTRLVESELEELAIALRDRLGVQAVAATRPRAESLPVGVPAPAYRSRSNQ